MTKNGKTILWFIIIFGLVGVAYISIVKPVTKRSYLQKKQNELADLLEININDYERYGFPDVYFYSELETGMTSEDIHKIVKGYEVVYYCEEVQSELYYYFSSDHNEATRFMIFYDKEDKYYDFLSEDPNSRVFGEPGKCIKGTIEE